MPFSIIPKLPEIMKAVKSQGFIDSVPLEVLRKQIKLTTGLYTDKGIATVIENLIEFGYVEQGIGSFKILVNYNGTPKPKEAKDPEEEADEFLNKFE
jgi:hypothetical protein